VAGATAGQAAPDPEGCPERTRALRTTAHARKGSAEIVDQNRTLGPFQGKDQDTLDEVLVAEPSGAGLDRKSVV
jgi:hypothetical protein